MGANYYQIIAILAIVIIGFFVFKMDALHVTGEKLTIIAMFIALSVALQFFSLMIPLFGFPSMRIGFSQLPLMVIGVLFGPAWAFISGIVQDFLGLIVTPTGFPVLRIYVEQNHYRFDSGVIVLKENQMVSQNGLHDFTRVIAEFSGWSTGLFMDDTFHRVRGKCH
jgi:ECF transporter S component (folate family)